MPPFLKLHPFGENYHACVSFKTSTAGRNMAGARALWRATGVRRRLSKPIIAIANSFTQFVPGHVHLKDMGQLVAREIEKSRRRRQRVQHHRRGRRHRHGSRRHAVQPALARADCRLGGIHGQRPLRRCLSVHLQLRQNHPGMLLAALRLNIPVIFVSGGPMERVKPHCLNTSST